MYNPQLKKHILAFMNQSLEMSPVDIAVEFERLSLHLWSDHIDRNPEYGRWSTWVLNGKRPQRWQDIPAVPVTLFSDLSLTCFPPMLAQHQFSHQWNHRSKRNTSLDGYREVYDQGSVLGVEYLVGFYP